MSTEVWRGVPGYPHYEVSSLGNVRSYKRRGRGGGVNETPKLLKPHPHNSGYLSHNLINERGEVKTVLIHALVLAAFEGPRPVGMITRHLDGNPHNNTRDNLRWGTYKENTEDSIAHGTSALAQGRLEKKLSDDDAVDIYRRAQAGESPREIHEDYPHVTLRLVRYVIAGAKRKKATKAYRAQVAS